MSEQVKIPLPRSLQEIVGALLFASQDPLSASELRDAVRAVEPEEGENAEVMDVYKTCTSREIDEAIKGLGKALEVAGCGFRLVCTGGTYRLQTVPSCGRYVRAMLKLDRPSRLGRASLETLAIIAYRQPITKSEIEDIRGVDVTANIKTLMDLQLIRLVGRSELPGHPFLYGTTQIFLDHFGISSLQQLNELDPTLQRSNPRLKAEQYKRVEKKTELEKAAEEAAKDEGVVEGEGEGKGEGEGEGKGEGVGEGKGEGVGEGVVEGEGEGAGEGEGEAVDKGAPAEDDDFFIDDTPDEFDDDDDEDEDEEDIDEEDENEDDDE